MIQVSFSFEGVSENATCRSQQAAAMWRRADLGEEQSWGKEGDIDDVEFPLCRFVDDAGSREHVAGET